MIDLGESGDLASVKAQQSRAYYVPCKIGRGAMHVQIHYIRALLWTSARARPVRASCSTQLGCACYQVLGYAARYVHLTPCTGQDDRLTRAGQPPQL